MSSKLSTAASEREVESGPAIAQENHVAKPADGFGDPVRPLAIRVRDLGKCYHIYDSPRDRLKQPIMSRLRRLVRRSPQPYFRQFWALRDISFEVERGEIVGIIGPNGAGKSTLLQIICGTLTPTLGMVETQGRVAALLELGTGFNPDFTGRENIYLNGMILGLSREEIDARFERIAAFAEIGDFIDQPVKTYSSGMYVRLAFAVVAHVDADLLVIDEALAVGDAFFTQKCMRFLRGFAESGTILFVSHSTNSVINLCDRAIWLDKGAIKSIGAAKETCEAYLEDLFAVTPDGGRARSPEHDTDAVSAVPAPQALELERLVTKNEIRLFQFQTDAASYTTGAATITEVTLLGPDGQHLTVATGLDEVRLRIVATANSNLESVIIGFFVKDSLGQSLFGDNTYLTYQGQPFCVKAGESVEADFDFVLPLLPNGHYSTCVAIAEGDPDNPIQHHWIHDALIFTVNSAKLRHGLVGIPMRRIQMSLLESEPLQSS